MGTYWAPGSLVAADGKTVAIPDAWKAAWKYFYDGMWTDHFIATGPEFDAIAEPAGGYAFFSGNVAMATNYLWITYGLGEDSGVKGDWDVACCLQYRPSTSRRSTPTRSASSRAQESRRGVPGRQLSGQGSRRRPARARTSTAACRPRRPSKSAYLDSLDSEFAARCRLAGRQRQPPVPRRSQLRVVHAQVR